MYRYVVIREDMSMSQKLVQLAHVCLTETPHALEDKVNICLLSVSDAVELHTLRVKCGFNNCKVFFDPDYHKGPTALVTKAYDDNDEARNLFKDYKLFR